MQVCYRPGGADLLNRHAPWTVDELGASSWSRSGNPSARSQVNASAVPFTVLLVRSPSPLYAHEAVICASTAVRLLTCTGVDALLTVPLPNWPHWLLPQSHAAPELVEARLWSEPTATDVPFRRVLTEWTTIFSQFYCDIPLADQRRLLAAVCVRAFHERRRSPSRALSRSLCLRHALIVLAEWMSHP
jgi:hypothetical protein